MEFYDVQITTYLGETVVLQVYASSSQEAESIACTMVETGEAGTLGREVIDCFAL